MIIRSLRADDVDAVVEFSVRAWRPVFESFMKVMGPGLDLVTFAVDRITEQGLPLAQIGTGGDPGHAPARHVYEKAGFTPVPLVQYYKALPGGRLQP